MTKFDVRNYLTKIYNVPVMDVKTVNVSGIVFTILAWSGTL